MLVVPVVMLGAVYAIRQHRLFPNPTDEDIRIRALILSADKVDVQVQYFVPVVGVGYLSDDAAIFKSSDLSSVLTSLNVEKGIPSNADQEPAAVFYFYKGKKVIGGLHTSYSPIKSDFFFTMDDIGKHAGIIRVLHSATVMRLRQFISRRPEIMRKLVKCGAYVGENRS